MPERRTPLYDIHLRTASEMVKGGGDFMFPLSYTSSVEEHHNTRTNVGMQDLSTMGEVDIKGPGAERLVNRLLVNEVRDMEPGQVVYSTMVNEEGGIIDDITAYKFSDDHFMIVTSSGPRKKSARWIGDHAAGTSAYTTDITASIALLSIQGPRSRDFLKSVARDTDLDGLRFFRFTRGQIHETEALISRTGYTGELGYELYIPAEEAAVLWEYLIQAGRSFGLRPYGVAAMQSLRIEKALPLYGPDIDESRTPFQVGLDRFIRFEKRDFVGREALLRLQDMGLQERWTGLVLESDIPAQQGNPIYSIADIATFREKMFSGSEAGEYFDRESPGMQVGTITSGAKGHTVGQMLALGYIQTTHSWPGSRLLVNVQGRPVLAKVAVTPFFDPQGARMRAKGTRKL
ncbi:MAG: glycine cleavage system aminomethyltransferase GcvT [Chloroflexi bacterium]|nr:glycine cleavage system aminomethyltransferase GcvT [Chloroflexota bacterium]